MQIGERIELRRTQMKMSRQDLANILSTDAKQVWRYETGRNSPTAEVIKSIALALGTTSDWLLGLSDELNPHYEESSLSYSEHELLKLYRAKSTSKQENIISMVRAI